MSWLDSLLVAALDNALGATVLAGVVFLITRWWRNPLVVHALWLLVLVKFVAPPIVPLHWGMSSASLLRLPDAARPAAVEPELVLPDAPAVAASHSPVGSAIENSRGVDSPSTAVELATPAVDSEAETPVIAPSLPAEPIAATETPIAASVSVPAKDAPTIPQPAQSPPANEPLAQPWRWQSVVALVWLLGGAAYLALAGVRIARFQRSLTALPAANERVQRLAAEVGQKLGYRGALTVRVAPGRTPPLLWAVGRPTILLPNELIATLGESELAGVLAHELAHLVRRDPWVRWFELLVVGLYWWHPVAWGARRALRDAEELACDALVLDRLGTGPEAYVRGLLHALDLATGAPGPSLASSLGRKGSLHRRVEAMLARRYAPRLSWAAGLMIGLLALAFVPLSMRTSPAEEAPKTNPVAAATTKAEETAKDGAESKAAGTPSETEAQDTLDPRLGPAADLDPRVRERYRQYLRPPYWRDEDMVTVNGKTIDEQGQPVANADVEVRAPGSGTITYTRSNAAGEFELRVPPGYLEHNGVHGKLLAKTDAGDLQGYTKLPASTETASITLRSAQPIEARVVDEGAAPVAGAAFTVVFGDGLTTSGVTNDQGVARVELPKAALLEQAFARKDGLGTALVVLDQDGQTPAEKVVAPLEFKFDGARTITVRTIDGRDGSPAAGLPVTMRMRLQSENGGGRALWELPELQKFTDEQGAAEFTCASPNLAYYLEVRGWDRILYARFESGKDDATETLELWPKVKVTGQARFADGRPAANMPVVVGGGQHQFEVRSGEDGKFSTEVEANRYYLLVAGDKQWASPAKAIVIGHESPPPIELVLGPAIRVFGTDPDFRRVRLDQSPDFAYENLPREQLLPLRLGELVGRPNVERTAETDADGNFEFFVGPGHYALFGPRDTRPDSIPTFTLSDQKELRVSLRDSPPQVRLKGKVVRRDDPQIGVAEAIIDLETNIPGPPLRSDSSGEFSVSVPDEDQLIEARAPGRLFGLVDRLQGTNEIIISVGPPSPIQGRVIDKSGTPVKGTLLYRIVRDRRGNWTPRFLAGGQVEIGGDGRFTLDRVAPGWNYTLWATLEGQGGKRRVSGGRPFGASHWLGTARSATGDRVDLGDIVVDVDGAADKPATKVATTVAAKAPVEPKALDPRLGPGEWVDPQVREYYRNYMLRPEWPQPTTIKGRVADAQGNPAAKVDVTAQTNLFGTIAVAKTDQSGEFEVASADSNPALIVTSNDGAFIGYFRAPQAEAEHPAQPYVLKLEPPREIDARVVDGQGQPVSAAIVTAIFGDGLTAIATADEQGRAKLRVPVAAPLEAVFARKDHVGLDVFTFDQEGKPERDVGASPFEFTLKGARTITVRAVDGRNGKPVPGVIASYRLSRNGKNHLLQTLAELCQFVGADGAARFPFAPLDEPASVNVPAYDVKLFPASQGYVSFDPQRSGNEDTLEFWPRVKLAGQVRFADGRPAPGLPVLVAGGQHGPRPDTTTTDADGKFALEVDANDYYLLAVGDKQWAAPLKTMVIGHESPPPVELTLGPAIRVFGRDPNLRRIVLTEHPATAYEALPRGDLLPLRLTPFPMRSQLQRTGETDVDGKYEFFVGPGTYSVEGPQGVARATTPRFTLTNEKEYDVDRGAPGAASARVKVRIVRADDPQVGLERARYYIHRFDRQPPEGKRSGAAGVVEVDSLGGRFVVEAQDDDQNLVGMVESKPGETELIVPLGPPAVVRGRLIDRAGRRFSGRVDYHAVQGNNVIQAGGNPSVSQGRAPIADDGHFVLDKLAPGWTYSLSASLNYPDEPRQGRYKRAWLGTAQAGPQPVDLGDILLESPETLGRIQARAPAATSASAAVPSDRGESTPRSSPATISSKPLLDQNVDPRVRAYLEQRWQTGEPDRKFVALRGKVVDAAGAPVADAEVTAEDAREYGTIAKTRSAANGEFELEVRAYPEGNLPSLLARDKDRKLIGMGQPSSNAEPVTITLAPAREVLTKVVDGQGQPVAGAVFTAFFANAFATSALTDAEGQASLGVLKDERLEISFASKDGLGFDYALYSPDGRLGDQPLPEPGSPPLVFTLDGARPVSVKVINGVTRQLVPGALVRPYFISRSDRRTRIMMHPDYAPLWKLTGDDGVANFDNIAKTEGFSFNVTDLRGELHRRERNWWSYPDRGGQELVVELWPKVALAGQVRFADGRPAPQLPVIVDGGAAPAVETLHTQTDEQGRFSINVEPDDYYLIAAGNKEWATSSLAIVVRHEPPPPIELTAQPAIRVFGSGSSVRELQLQQRPEVDYVELPREQFLPLRETPRQPLYPAIWRTVPVDADGKFEVFVGPGKYALRGPDDVKLEYTPHFVLTDQKAKEVSLRQNERNAPQRKLRVERLDEPGVLVPNARVSIARRGRQSEQPVRSRVEPTGEGTFADRGEDLGLQAASADELLVGAVDWNTGGGDVVIRIGPSGSVRGRIVDPSGGKVVGTISYTTDFNGEEELRGASMIYGQFVKLDDEGRFVFDKLVPGVTYSLRADITYPFSDNPPTNSIYQRGWFKQQWLGPVKPKSGETVDLGDIAIEP